MTQSKQYISKMNKEITLSYEVYSSKSARRFAIVNQKGGVAKSTTTDALGHTFASMGLRVLLIDLDSQGNLTTGLNVQNQDMLKNTTYELMLNIFSHQEVVVSDYVIHVRDNLDLIPANIALADIDLSLNRMTSNTDSKHAEYQIINTALNAVENQYDLILIDCSPSLGMLTVNALAAVDKVIIPSAPELYSAKGMELLIGSILKVKKRYNPRLDFEGIIFTLVNETYRVTQIVKNAVVEAFGKHIHIFDVSVPRSTEIGLSLAENGKSIMFRRLTSNDAVNAYKKIAIEIAIRNNFLSSGKEVKEETQC